MNYFLIIFLFAVIIIGFMLAGIGIKMLVKKNGEFKKQCSVVDPVSGKRVGCTCGKTAFEDCKKNKKYHPLEINKEVLKEL